MKLFKTENNEIYAYELDGSQDHLIGNITPITQEEADSIIASRPEPSIPINELKGAA